MVDPETAPTLGALPSDSGGVNFRVWAPQARSVELQLEDGAGGGAGRAADGQGSVPMAKDENGYFSTHQAFLGAGTSYRFRLDGQLLPDPASRWQPEGVHGPSSVVDPRGYDWSHTAPQRRDLTGRVIYELHVGTFTREGTFAALVERLPSLVELGVDIIELMPVADFPGRWNWGYDPGAQFAPSRAYGKPDELRRLVDEAHGLGLLVLLDVVYNHFGPDGAYLPAFSPYALTDRHHTPWGQAIDFDGPQAQGVRRYFRENALMWLSEYRFDGLRLDATFAIVDDSPNHFLRELADSAAALPGPERLLIAEDPRNQRNVVLRAESGGLGMHAVWADDFHHQVRVRLAGDGEGYYADFAGTCRDIASTLERNWFYCGHHSRHHGRPRGTGAADLPPERFVYCIQNHDQVGNRPTGERLHHAVPRPEYHAASALLLFAPQTPLLFMGQEWAASTPFLFFTDHAGELGERVSEGRKQEFAAFSFGSEVPDPQDPATFERSRLRWDEREQPSHSGTLQLYRDLLRLRKMIGGELEVEEVETGGLALRRGAHLLLVAFEPGCVLRRPSSSTIVWRSEDPAYVEDPRPPGEQAMTREQEAVSAQLPEAGLGAGNDSDPATGSVAVTFRRAGALIVQIPGAAE